MDWCDLQCKSNAFVNSKRGVNSPFYKPYEIFFSNELCLRRRGRMPGLRGILAHPPFSGSLSRKKPNAAPPQNLHHPAATEQG